jgi:hypothetical protein
MVCWANGAWISKDCGSGKWCSSCDDWEGECRACHHKAWEADATMTVSNGTSYDYKVCTGRATLINNCRQYSSITEDTGKCSICEPGFFLATNKTWCENFTDRPVTCGNWCMSCDQNVAAPYYDACHFCFPEFTVDTTNNKQCLEANTTNANTGVWKCKHQKTTNCLECKVGHALNYAQSACTETTNLKCGVLFQDTVDECYLCYHGYVMINNKTCALDSGLIGNKLFTIIGVLIGLLVISGWVGA